MDERVIVDGEEYRKVNGYWVDSSYCIPPQSILSEIYKSLIDVKNLSKYSESFLEKHLAEMKNSGLYIESLIIIKHLLPKYEIENNITKLRYILPIYTSCLRLSGKPKSAILVFNKATDFYGKAVISGMLVTSVAAAYCDLGELQRAYEFCNRAYALQDGNQGENEELSLVYKRIEKQLKR